MQLVKILVLWFLLVTPCFADDPNNAISYPATQLMGFRGLDTDATAPTIQDGRAVDLQNVKLSAALDLRKRRGYSIINATLDDGYLTSPALVGLFDAEYSTGTSFTIAFLGDRIKYDNVGVWTEISNQNKVPVITSNQDNQFACIMALDEAICTNDAQAPIKINVTPRKAALSFTGLSSAVTKVKTMVWFRNYLILGNTYEGSTERPTRFRWSDVGTIETWQDDNFTDIATFGGDEIVGFAELYSELYIFLKRSIWKASLTGGDDVFVFSKAVDGIGAIARDSIQVIQLSGNRTAIIFLDDKKRVLMYDGASVVDVGASIQEQLDTLSPSRLQYAQSTFDGSSYLLSGTTSGGTTNDILLELQTEIFEWTKHTDINANVLAQIKESTSVIKTYFGNYKGFVYWLDDTDQAGCDVNCATGIIDSTGTMSGTGFTGNQVLIDSALASGGYTGAIVKIVSGTGSGQEAVVISSTTTSVVLTTSLSTTPDSTSVYSIGAIDAYYYGKHYDMGQAQKEKKFLNMLLFAGEDTSDQITVSHAIDFGSTIKSTTISLAPSGSSLWDVALWDQGAWGTTGDKIYTVSLSGYGNFIQPKFTNDGIDEDFHLYGFNLFAVVLDTKQ